MEKLLLKVVHTGEEIRAQFNPEEYSLNRDNTFAAQAVPGLSGPLLQFVNGNLQTLELELFFDTWDSDSPVKRDVRELTGRVLRLLDIDKELHAPPVLDVLWGSLELRCVLARANQKFEMFADDGRPVRARITCTFNRVIDAAQEARQVDRQTADFTKVHVVVEGQTLAGIATLHYQDPLAWRPIALANRMDDPRALVAGDELLIPSLPYTHPETGVVVR